MDLSRAKPREMERSVMSHSKVQGSWGGCLDLVRDLIIFALPPAMDEGVETAQL